LAANKLCSDGTAIAQQDRPDRHDHQQLDQRESRTTKRPNRNDR